MRTLPLRMAAFLLALTPLALVAGACTTEDGATPSCVADVDPSASQGGNPGVAHGCNPFPVCTVNGETVDADECCVDPESKARFTGRQLEECLYGFGEVGSINVSSSSTTGGGAGGSGGGAGGSGGAGGR